MKHFQIEKLTFFSSFLNLKEKSTNCLTIQNHNKETGKHNDINCSTKHKLSGNNNISDKLNQTDATSDQRWAHQYAHAQDPLRGQWADLFVIGAQADQILQPFIPLKCFHFKSEFFKAPYPEENSRNNALMHGVCGFLYKQNRINL